MNAPEMLLIMLVLRVVIPVGLVMWIGETQQRRQLAGLHKNAGRL